MAGPVAIIFGAGPNVGISVARKFTSKGYKVIGVARSPKQELEDVTHKAIAADLSNLQEVDAVFHQVEAQFGPPSFVFYNGTSNSAHIEKLLKNCLAYSASFGSADDPFAPNATDLAKDLAVNTISAYAAAKAALASFVKLEASGSKHNRLFVYTGNMQSSLIVPETLTLGVSKNAVAYAIETAANVYGKRSKGAKGFWYFADERFEDGGSMMAEIDGESHAEHLWNLANQRDQGPWNNTFVKGKGYVSFDDTLADRKVATVPELMAKAKEAVAQRQKA